MLKINFQNEPLYSAANKHQISEERMRFYDQDFRMVIPKSDTDISYTAYISIIAANRLISP
jgi:hypothetical protein